MATVTIKHASLTGAAANPAVLVDGPKWDATHTVTGIENVDNTSDLNKPVSTATQTALDAKAATFTLTTTGTSGAATYAADVLNIPQYGGGTPGGTSGQGQYNNAGAFGGYTVSGDMTANFTTGAFTLATVNSNVGLFGSATAAATFTVDGKGRLTAAGSTTVTPAVGSITGLGTGIGTFLATPSSANLRAALTDEVGTGAAYFVGGALGTPASGTLTSCTAFTLTTTGTSGAATYSAGTLNVPQYAGGVTSLNGATGALVNYFTPGGRLTLSTGVAVMGSSVAGSTTVYYTPYAGNMVPIYDGTNMVPTATAEISQATTDTTKSPAAVAASKVYDIFVWNDSGTIRATRGPAWTNSTTRGYTLTAVNGILLNSSSITNGPAASRGTWVGTIASNASSTIDWILGSGGSGGVAGVLNVWNAYNRVDVTASVLDSGTTYAYTTATVRQARASAGNQVSFVVGNSEDSASAIYTGFANVSAIGAFIRTGIGVDTTTVFTAGSFLTAYANGITLSQNTAWQFAISGPGTHFVAALEQGDGTNGNAFDVSSNMQLSFKMRM